MNSPLEIELACTFKWKMNENLKIGFEVGAEVARTSIERKIKIEQHLNN